MSSLEQFGILPSNTTSPALSGERCVLDNDAYSEEALAILGKVSDFVITEAASSLDTYVSRWHPSGFMVYQLGISPGLGMLRLHVWPNTERKGSEKGDTIHDHAWHVASLVLRGSYIDTIFDVDVEGSLSEYDRKARGLLRLFDASYNADASQELKTDGTCVRVTPSHERTIIETETHTIEPGIFHQPTIAREVSVATLVLNSFRVHENGPFVLIDGPPDPIPEVRNPLSEENINTTRQLLVGQEAF